MILSKLRQAAVTRIGTKLPDYFELNKIFSVENNSERKLKQGFSVITGEGLPNNSQCRTLGFDQVLTVSLSNKIPMREGDTIAPMLDTLLDDVETIVKNFPNDTYLGLTEIRGIKVSSVSPPTLFSENRFLKIDIRFLIDVKMNIDY